MKTWTKDDTVFSKVGVNTYATYKEKSGCDFVYIVARVVKGKFLRIAEVLSPFEALEIVRRNK